MRETYQPPTTAPAGPPHDHTHPRHSPHSPTSFPTLTHVIPTLTHVIPHTHPRHSPHSPTSFPHSPTSFPHSPTSFPRRRESPPLCPNSRRDSPPPAVDRNRHNETEFDEPQQKLVPARDARARQPAFRFASPGMDCRRQLAADSTYRLELPSHKHHPNESTETIPPN